MIDDVETSSPRATYHSLVTSWKGYYADGNIETACLTRILRENDQLYIVYTVFDYDEINLF